MRRACLVFLFTLVSAGAAPAQTLPAPRGSACHGGVQHVSLLSPAQMCPRPLATTVIARPRHATLHT